MTDETGNPDEHDDTWDEAIASALIGHTLLVGLTYVRKDDEIVERKQVFGTVLSCHPTRGIAIKQHKNGGDFIIAPVLDAIEPGVEGIYQMTDEDEEVKDPDFTALIRITLAS